MAITTSPQNMPISDLPSCSHSPADHHDGSAFRKHTTNTEDTHQIIPSFLPNLRRAASLMVIPEKPLSKAPTTWRSIRTIIFSSWLNVLLVFIPISWAFHFAAPNWHTLIFVSSFLAIIPSAKLLAFATDELSIRVGEILAGLLNATLGNAIELMVSIIALMKCELTIVQSSMVGSMLTNLLLVLGLCFFFGGLRYSEQGFGQSAVQLHSSLLTVGSIAVLLPSVCYMASQGQPSYSELSTDDKILHTSHGVAVVLLFEYGSYLVFQLFSHKSLYRDDHADIQPSKEYAWLRLRRLHTRIGFQNQASSSTEFEVEPSMSITVTLCLLLVVVVLLAVTVEVLVDSIDGFTKSGTISKEFVGVILLPIVVATAHCVEHFTAVTASLKDRLTLSLSVAVGSSIQIALFVIPFVVILGWILGKPLSLLFDPLESVVLFLSVLTVNSVVQDGKSNWMEGMLLICLYLVLAITFWHYSGSSPTKMSC